jgi:hypothetical protein
VGGAGTLTHCPFHGDPDWAFITFGRLHVFTSHPEQSVASSGVSAWRWCRSWSGGRQIDLIPLGQLEVYGRSDLLRIEGRGTGRAAGALDVCGSEVRCRYRPTIGADSWRPALRVLENFSGVDGTSGTRPSGQHHGRSYVRIAPSTRAWRTRLRRPGQSFA